MIKNKLHAVISGAVIASSSVLIPGMPSVALAEEVGLEEITVTARRRDESLMSTPVSVTAFTGEDLQQRQIERVHEIGASTPNLEFRNHANAGSSNSNAVVYIRGVGQSDFAVSTEPGVGIYVDEAYISQASGAVIDLVDIESIQVLRGPQGTLFGRNTIGGAVLVNTVKPNEEFGGSAHATLGTDELREVGVKVNVPLTDTLFSRLSFQARERDGWVDYVNVPGSDGGGSDETWGARLALRWLATDDLTIDFSADYTDTETDGPPNIVTRIENFNSAGGLTNAGQYNIAVAPFAGLTPAYDNTFVTKDDAYKNFGTFFEGGEQEIWGGTLTVAWDLDAFSLKSITNYREIESTDGRDEDGSPMEISHVRDDLDAEQFSQEFQLSGQAFDDKLTWTTGVYYFEDEAVNINPVQFPHVTLVSGAIVEKESSAWFGQASYDLSDKWSLTVGARYTDENKDFLVDDRIQYVTSVWLPFLDPANPPIFVFPPPNAVTLAAKGKTEANINNKDYHANLSYQWTEDLLVYASYSEGFKGGGFVQRVIPGQAVTSYDPEFAEVYELGFKWEGETLRLTGALFYTDYSDLQITLFRVFAPVTENAGDAEIYGAELEFLWIPSDNWKISGGVGLLDAEYTTEINDDSGLVSKDDDLASTPELQYNLSASYTWPEPVLSGALTFRLDYSYQSDYYMEAANDPDQEQKAFGLLNGAITWVSESEQWEVALRGRNLTDEVYWTSPQGGVEANGIVGPTVGQPVEYSLRVGFRF